MMSLGYYWGNDGFRNAYKLIVYLAFHALCTLHLQLKSCMTDRILSSMILNDLDNPDYEDT